MVDDIGDKENLEVTDFNSVIGTVDAKRINQKKPVPLLW